MPFIDGTRISKVDGSLRIGGPGQPNANLAVSGQIVGASLALSGNLTVGGAISAQGGISVGNTLTLAGGVMNLSTITADSFTATGPVNTPTLVVSGGPTTAGAVTASSLACSGTITAPAIQCSGNIVAAGTLQGSSLNVGSNFAIDAGGNITNANAATFSGPVNCNGGFQAPSALINGVLNVNGVLNSQAYGVGVGTSALPGVSVVVHYANDNTTGTCTFKNGLLVGLS